MTLEDLISLFARLTEVTFLIKIFLLTFTLLYTILALVVFRQTQLMVRILDEVNFSPLLKFIAFVHFLAAVAVFILAIILL